jgi:hypothetical protein
METKLTVTDPGYSRGELLITGGVGGSNLTEGTAHCGK